MSHSSSDNLAEALKLLEEAASQKKDELKSLVSDKYTHLRSVIVETENNLSKSLTQARKHAGESATHARDASVEKAREITRDVDKCVHQNPWAYITGAAVVGLLMGVMLERNPK